jgi:hypothetical protein
MLSSNSKMLSPHPISGAAPLPTLPASLTFLSAEIGPTWASTQPTGNEEKLASEAAEARRILDRLLTDALVTDNLLVLAGLGTSRCVKHPTGKFPAPTMPVLWQAAADQAASTFEQIKSSVRYVTPQEGDNIETLLSQCQLSQLLQPDPFVEKFIIQTEALIVERCRFVDESVDLQIHETFLRKVARRSTRLPRVKFFTTNYDLAFERAASRSGFIVVDGFSHTQPQEFDGTYFDYDFVRRDDTSDMPDYIPNVCQLHKMHGSVDWEVREGRTIRTPNADRPLIIYPRNSKFESSYDQPFIEMMSRFQVALRQPNTALMILGFGFNDRHISQPIMSAIRSNVSLRAIVVAPDLQASKNSTIQEMTSLIRSGDSRVILINSTFEDLVPMLPALVTGTEEEQHRRRLRGIATDA